MTHPRPHRWWRMLLPLILLCTTLASLATPVVAHPVRQRGLTGEIAYVYQGDIYLLDLATGETKRLTNDGTIGGYDGNTSADLSHETAIAWSPDGALLAFTSSRQGSADIYTLNIASGDITQITNDPAREFAPSFTPDGALGFIRSLDPWEGGGGDEGHSQVIRLDSAGGEEIIYEQQGQPCNLAGLSFADQASYALGIDCRSTVDVSLMSGGSESPLSPFVTRPCSAPSVGRDYYAQNAVWAHRGTLLAFIGADCAIPDALDWPDAMFVIDFSGPNPVAQKVYTRKAHEKINSLGWAPDDQRLVFATAEPFAGLNTLWVVDVQGGEPQQISTVGNSPAWRPQLAAPTPTATTEPPTATTEPPTVTVEPATVTMEPMVTVEPTMDSALPTIPLPPMIDRGAALRLLDTLAVTVTNLKTLPAEISLLSIKVPTLGYDQKATQERIAAWRSQIENDTLTPEQLDAITRFALMEQALYDSRFSYTDIASKIADLSVDIAKIPVGTSISFKHIPMQDACKFSRNMCTAALKKIDDLAWKLVEQAKAPMLSLVPAKYRDSAEDFYDLAIAAERVRFDQSKGGFIEWFQGKGLNSAATAMLVKFHYQSLTQPVLDKSVRTTRLDAGGADRWPITSDIDQAQRHLRLQVEQSHIDRDYVVEDHEDTKLRTENLKLAETAAEAATLSPLFVLAKWTELAIKTGRAIGELWIINTRYAPRLACVVYRSQRLGELAFNAKQPFVVCPLDPQASLRYSPSLAPMRIAYHSAPPLSPIQRRLLSDSDQYRQAVQNLNQAIQSHDLAAIEAALNQLITATDAQQVSLQTMSALLLEHELLSSADVALLQQGNNATANAIALYLATIETASAQQENIAPQTDLAQVTQDTLSTLDQLEQAVPAVDLSPPADRPVVLIRKVQTQVVGQELQFDVTFANIGGSDVRDLRVDIAVDGVTLVAPVPVGNLPLGAEQRATVRIPLPQNPNVIVRVLSQDVPLDTYLTDVPPVAATHSAEVPAPTPPTMPSATPREAATGTGNLVLIVIAVVAVVIVLGLGGFWLLRRSAR